MKKTLLALSLLSVFSTSAFTNDLIIASPNKVTTEISPLVYNGQEYDGDSQSFYARIIVGSDGSYSQHCGASILDDQHILTAAHCLVKNVTDENNVTFSEQLDPATVFISMAHSFNASLDSLLEIDSFVIHEDYSSTTYNNDIAVIKLKTPLSERNWIEKDSEITSIPFFNDYSEPESYNSTDTSSEIVTVIGLGVTDDNESLPSTLMTAELELETDAYCKEFLETTFINGSYPDDNKMLCTVGQSKACSGDSGGPLSYLTNDGYQQIGIVSFSDASCEDTTIPGYYTEIYDYYEFLTEQVGEDVAPLSLKYTNANNINYSGDDLDTDTGTDTDTGDETVSTDKKTTGSSTGIFALSLLAFVRLFRKNNA